MESSSTSGQTDDVIRRSLAVARAAESLNLLNPGDWPDVATALILEGAPDLEFGELAALGRAASGWEAEPLVSALYERYDVAEQTPDEAVALMAGLAAADLRRSPVVVTSPMIRLLARLAPPDFASEMACRAFYAEEFLDCDCRPDHDPSLETELESLPDPDVTDGVAQAVMDTWRSALPAGQPSRGHG